jgi:hypothetical protein
MMELRDVPHDRCLPARILALIQAILSSCAALPAAKVGPGMPSGMWGGSAQICMSHVNGLPLVSPKLVAEAGSDAETRIRLELSAEGVAILRAERDIRVEACDEVGMRRFAHDSDVERPHTGRPRAGFASLGIEMRRIQSFSRPSSRTMSCGSSVDPLSTTIQASGRYVCLTRHSPSRCRFSASFRAGVTIRWVSIELLASMSNGSRSLADARATIGSW